MGPGQVAVALGSWVGVSGTAVLGQLGLRLDAPLTKRVGVAAVGGVQRTFDGAIEPRDSVIAATWTPVSRPDLWIAVSPGLSLPTGGVGQGLLFTELSTSSVDPWASLDLVAGTTWLVATSASARVPVYDGWDLRRQGPYGRFDLRGARRFNGWVPSVGLSVAHQGPADPRGSAPEFDELAATGSVVVNLSKRWSVSGGARVPLAVTRDDPRVIAGGVGARVVVGRRPGHPDPPPED